MTDERDRIFKEIDAISANVALIREKVNDTEIISIRADQLMALCVAVVPIRCHSFDCMYSRRDESCFLNNVELEEGICRFYKPAPKGDWNIDRTDLPGGFFNFIQGLRRRRREESDKE